MKAYRKVELALQSFLNSALHAGMKSGSHPCQLLFRGHSLLYPLNMHRILLGFRSGLDDLEAKKIPSSCQELNTSVV
jgi:hypothetical protein